MGFWVNESACCEEINNLGADTQRPPLLVLSQRWRQHVIDMIVFNFKKDGFRAELELEFSYNGMTCLEIIREEVKQRLD